MPKKEDNGINNVDKLIENTFVRLKEIIDANTIIGKTIKLGEKVSVIPISKVSVGLVTGGGQMPVKKLDMNTLGSTTGFSLIPIGFLTISKDTVNYVPTNVTDNPTSKLIDSFMLVYDKFLGNKGEENEEN